jgi:apolipoprotein N-acyltransferase
MLCPALSTVVCVFTLPPVAWWPLALVQWIPLIWWAAHATPGVAAAGGALSGCTLGFYLYFGAAVLDLPTYLLASGVLGLAFAVFFATVPVLFRHAGAFAPYALGALWAALELGLAFLKLPFSLALTLSPAPILLQAAALGGTTVVVLLLIAVQCAVVRCALPHRRLVHWRIALSALLVAAALTLLGNAHRPQSIGSVTAAAAQTDLHPFWYVHSEADGHLERLNAERQAIYALIADDNVDVLVWPEVPFARFDLRNPSRPRPEPSIAQLIAGNDLDARGRQFNAVVGLDNEGVARSRHSKSVLLPRLERKYQIGTGPQPHGQLPGRPGSLICFESAFSAPARALGMQGAGFLSIATSDAYAGPSALAALHGAFAVLRAIENRRAVVRAANGGPSMIVDERGVVLHRAAQFETAVIQAPINVIVEATLFARHASLIHLAVVLFGVGAVLASIYIATNADASAAAQRHPPRLAAAGALLVLATAGLTVAQSSNYAARFARAHDRDIRPALGFLNTLDASVSYAQLRSTSRENDLAAAAAALARRFGIAQSAGDVEQRVRAMEKQSVFRVDAKSLIADYGLATTAWNGNRDHSTIPCVAVLNNKSVVLVSRVSGPAVEVFSPSEASYSSVPRAWLTSALAEAPVCVIGRAFPWDLAP